MHSLTGYNGSSHSLAYEEHINGTKIEFVKIRQRSKTVVGRMLASVKLTRILSVTATSLDIAQAYHHGFALILNDVTGSSNLVPTAKAEKH